MSKRLSSDMRFFLFYVLAFSIITVRTIAEFSIGHLSPHYILFFHHDFWFFQVFLMYLVVFRYVVGVPVRALPRLTFLFPVIWLPIIAQLVWFHRPIRVNYLSFRSVHYWRDIVTLMYFHSKNYSVFLELGLVLTGTALLAWLLSKSVFRSVSAAVISYLILTVVHGTIWIGPMTFKEPFFKVHTTVHPHIFLSSFFFALIFLYLFILFLPEIKRYLVKQLFSLATIVVFVVVFAMFYAVLFGVVGYGQNHHFVAADMVVLIGHPFCYALAVTAWKTPYRGFAFFMTFLSVLSAASLFPLFAGFIPRV